MLKPINNIANRVADGRRFASRSIVLTSLTAIACYVFRREVIAAEDGESRAETVWEGGMVLSEQDEHATEYKEQGYAMLMFDRFIAGSMHSDYGDINLGEALQYAQIEPFYIDNYQSKTDMLKNIPDWRPKKGDIFALVINEDLIKWMECVGISGQSLHGNHGERYALNVRDSLMHLDPFRTHEDLLKPASSPFPMALSELLYSDAPIFNLVENDPTKLSDDEVTVKNFKLVNISDPALQNYSSILAVKHIINRTNSPYIFTAADQAKISVNVGPGDHFILSADTPVQAIEANSQFISYMLMMIDHVGLVSKITDTLAQNKAVQVLNNGQRVFEILPLHFDEVRKAYHFVFTIALGEVSDFTLQLEGGAFYPFTIDATGLEVAL